MGKTGTVHGFTLMEVLIALLIIGILAAIAYPSYQEQVRQTRRAECTGALMALASAMERHYTENDFSYEGAAVDGENAGPPDIFPATCPTGGGTTTYTLSLAADAGHYTLSATPVGPQAGDRCGVLSLTETGVRGASGPADLATCW